MKKWKRWKVKGFWIVLCTVLLFAPVRFLSFGAELEEEKEEKFQKKLHAQSAVLLDADTGRFSMEKRRNRFAPWQAPQRL